MARRSKTASSILDAVDSLASLIAYGYKFMSFMTMLAAAVNAVSTALVLSSISHVDDNTYSYRIDKVTEVPDINTVDVRDVSSSIAPITRRSRTATVSYSVGAFKPITPYMDVVRYCINSAEQMIFGYRPDLIVDVHSRYVPMQQFKDRVSLELLGELVSPSKVHVSASLTSMRERTTEVSRLVANFNLNRFDLSVSIVHNTARLAVVINTHRQLEYMMSNNNAHLDF